MRATFAALSTLARDLGEVFFMAGVALSISAGLAFLLWLARTVGVA